MYGCYGSMLKVKVSEVFFVNAGRGEICAAVEMTFQFVFIAYLGLFDFLTFSVVGVIDSHSCSFTFLIFASECIFFLWHVVLKDMI